jgi:hypothetical protein
MRAYKSQLDLIDKPSFAGLFGFVSTHLAGTNPTSIGIWGNAFGALATVDAALRRGGIAGSMRAIVNANKDYKSALIEYLTWKFGVWRRLKRLSGLHRGGTSASRFKVGSGAA